MPNHPEKVLIVESDSMLGQRIIDVLTKSGYGTRLIKTGSEALEAIQTYKPNLVILDVSLDGIDGYEILEKKMADKNISDIPVFLISSQGLPINMRKVPQRSVMEYLMALQLDPASVVEKVDRQFNHESINLSSLDSNAPKKKLVWVEDDKLIGNILSKKFLSSGFDLFHAKNGEEALEALKSSIPDVIALDLMLPGMSGFDILQNIRMDDRLKNVPVIILSNLSKASDFEKARVLGAQKFMVKAAASLDQIVAEVRALCK